MFKKLISLAVDSLLVLALGWPAARPALAAPTAPASATTFTVNSWLDQPDDNVGDWICHTAGGVCTLRAAVEQANSLPGAMSPITINVPAGTYTLTLGSLNLTNNLGLIGLVGAGAATTIIDGNQNDRVLSVAPNTVASIRGVTVRGGLLKSLSDGGGIRNDGVLTLDHSVVSGNRVNDWGGGVYNSGNLTVIQSTIAQNQAVYGGGLFNDLSSGLTLVNSTVSGNNAAYDGGGFYNNGTATVTNSTLSGNSAADKGGGLYTASATQLTLINSTVSQNSSVADGGGLYNTGTANIYNTTIVFNLADSDHTGAGTGGGVFNYPSAVVSLRYSLVAGNGTGSTAAANHDDCTGTLAAYGGNLIAVTGDTSPCTLTIPVNGFWQPLNSLALLGPLQDNGGPTLTHALLAGSNAIDGAALHSGCLGPDSNPLPTDQRGLPRIIGPYCDIGAFEFSPLTATLPLLVNSLLDQVDDDTRDGLCHTGSNTCTLRAAIMQAAVLPAAYSPVTISVPAGTYTLTLGSLTVPSGLAVIHLVGAGAESTIIDAHQIDRVLKVDPGGQAILSGLTLTGGRIPTTYGAGGGIDNLGTLTLDHSTVSGSQVPAGYGGGVANADTLTVVDSTLGPNNAADQGGGLWNNGTLMVVRSTVFGNQANLGGGIYNRDWPASLMVVNSTLSQNRSVNDGGGLYNKGLTNAYNTTIVINLADAGQAGLGTGGGVFNYPDAQFNLRNTLVAGNGSKDYTVAHHSDCSGTLTVYGQNRLAVAGDAIPCTLNTATGGWTYLNSLDPLGVLRDNGGASWTHALLPGSNAIDGGDPAGCLGPDNQALATDERGQPRLVGAQCDIGAFEFTPLVAAAPMTVDSPLDQVDADTRDGVCRTASNTCTLRAAIMQADQLPDSISGVTITVPAGLYQLTLPGTPADDAAGDDLNLTAGAPVIRLVGAGAASTLIDANHLSRALTVAAGRTANLSGVTLTGGLRHTIWGGGVYNLGTLTLDHDTISGNQAIDYASGGGIFNYGGTLIVNSSTISGNVTDGSGGGIINYWGTLTMTASTVSSNHALRGGGLASNSRLTVVGSTLSGNSADAGGGLYDFLGASLNMINSTLSHNTAASDGGGVYNQGTANVYNSTIVFNLADADQNSSGAGGGLYAVASSVNLRNSLLAGNGVGTLETHNDCTGIIYSWGQNLFGATGDAPPCTINIGDGGNWDYLNSLQLLGPLQDNGGPTWTHALLPGNDGVNWGDPVQGCIGPDSQLLSTDQRGLPRVAGAYCDIGAFELTVSVMTSRAYLPIVQH